MVQKLYLDVGSFLKTADMSPISSSSGKNLSFMKALNKSSNEAERISAFYFGGLGGLAFCLLTAQPPQRF